MGAFEVCVASICGGSGGWLYQRLPTPAERFRRKLRTIPLVLVLRCGHVAEKAEGRIAAANRSEHRPGGGDPRSFGGSGDSTLQGRSSQGATHAARLLDD